MGELVGSSVGDEVGIIVGDPEGRNFDVGYLVGLLDGPVGRLVEGAWVLVGENVG